MVRFALIILLLLNVGCSPDDEPVVDSNSNWLLGCNEDAPCGSKFTCECGYCSTECESDTDCEIEGSVCVTRSTYESNIVCGVQELTRGTCIARCDEARDCPNKYACARNVCVDVSQTCALGDYEFAQDEEQARTMFAMRQNTDICSGGVMLSPAPNRVGCVARLTAMDMDAQNFSTLPDPEGFTLADRLEWMDAGVGFNFGKAYAIEDAPDPATLMMLISMDMEFCGAFSDPQAQGFWISRSASVWFVMVLAPENN